MSFWKVVAGTATGVLVAYAAVRFPALWDAYRTQQGTKETERGQPPMTE